MSHQPPSSLGIGQSGAKICSQPANHQITHGLLCKTTVFFGKTSSFIIELYLGHGFQFANCSSEHVRTRGY